MKLRLAGEYDLDELLRLERSAFSLDRFSEDQIYYFLARSRATVFVLEEDDVLVGAAYLLWHRSHRSARLYSIAVDPAYKGRGLGRKLMAAVEIEASRRGCPSVALEVRQDNTRAIEFYERLDYRVTGTLPDYYEDGMAGYKMSKTLRRRPTPKKILKVPYCPQSLDFTCGAATLMMVLKYYKPSLSPSRALELRLWKESTLIFMSAGFGGSDAFGMALAGVERGLSCRMVSNMLDSPPFLRSVRSTEKREVIEIVHNDLKRRAREARVDTAGYDFGIDEIVSALYRNNLPVVLISTYRLTGDRVPHWVVVTGFDRDHLYIHDSDLESYDHVRARAKNIRIPKREFLKMSRYGKEAYRCLLEFGRG